MYRLAVCCLLAVLAAACEQKSTPAAAANPPVDTQAAPAALTSTACPGGAVNDQGLGKACAKASDCLGGSAITCLKEQEGDGFDFCTKFCFGLKPDECGPNGKCIPRGAKASVCAPAACADKLAVAPAEDVTITFPCTVGSINDYGVGKVCEKNAECAGLVAKICPYEIRPQNPQWCSMLCAADSECGPNAFCWRRMVEENGRKFNLGSCAPIACQSKKK